MRHHGASLTRQRTETKPVCQLGSYGTHNGALWRRIIMDVKDIVQGHVLSGASVTVGESKNFDLLLERLAEVCAMAGFPFNLATRVWHPPLSKWLLTPSILLHTESWREDCPLSTPVCIPTVQAILMFSSVLWRTSPESLIVKKKQKKPWIRRRNRRVSSPHLWQFAQRQAQ